MNNKERSKLTASMSSDRVYQDQGEPVMLSWRGKKPSQEVKKGNTMRGKQRVVGVVK